MEQEFEDQDFGGETESLEEKPAKKKQKDAFKVYGDDWDGQFMKIGEMISLIPVFKEFYLEERKKNVKKSAIVIIQEFNKKIAPIRFYPYPTQYRTWRTKWDSQVMAELGYEEQRIAQAKRVNDVIKVRDEERATTLVPTEDELEGGIKTLGGMLTNDAVRMLQDDQELEDIYDSDQLIKRKTYVLNVFAHVTRHVQGKEALKIKKQGENRETAGFLMHLLGMAKAGKLDPNDMTVLKSAVAPQPTVIEVTPTE